jgi:hypothetical protein
LGVVEFLFLVNSIEKVVRGESINYINYSTLFQEYINYSTFIKVIKRDTESLLRFLKE